MRKKRMSVSRHELAMNRINAVRAKTSNLTPNIGFRFEPERLLLCRISYFESSLRNREL